jgi:cytochrome c peroxidase
VSIVTRGVPTEFSLMEANFSLFWGLSIQLYTAILVSNQSPFDNGTMTPRQLAGQAVFNGAGRCNQCHAAPRFTSAAINMNALPAVQFVSAGTAFANIGVRPIAEDTGLVASAAASAGTSAGDGKFKVPELRNVELTGPYFHSGGFATLRQVLDFYEHGGNFPVSGITGIAPLTLTTADKDALVDFMLALTDERVRRERAPFDHPSLDRPNGVSLPAVGMGGGTAIARFLGLDPFAP